VRRVVVLLDSTLRRHSQQLQSRLHYAKSGLAVMVMK
jgi:hypothetical protein